VGSFIADQVGSKVLFFDIQRYLLLVHNKLVELLFLLFLVILQLGLGLWTELGSGWLVLLVEAALVVVGTNP
jgi:hypothetical protein